MNKNIFQSLLACPKCKEDLSIRKSQAKCLKCQKIYRKIDGIWNLLITSKTQSKIAKKKYDRIFRGKFHGPQDGSYNILAAMAQGNRTIDIACGCGDLEIFSPDTIGVDFSLSALKQAQTNGAKYLVLADAHNLPFKKSAFNIAICAGGLEHFANPQQVLSEISRISSIQVLIVHSYPQIIFGYWIYKLISMFWRIQHQPIENPLSQKILFKMLTNADLKLVFFGVWTLPLNYGRPIKFLPEFKKISSSWFVITIKNRYDI